DDPARGNTRRVCRSGGSCRDQVIPPGRTPPRHRRILRVAKGSHLTRHAARHRQDGVPRSPAADGGERLVGSFRTFPSIASFRVSFPQIPVWFYLLVLTRIESGRRAARSLKQL